MSNATSPANPASYGNIIVGILGESKNTCAMQSESLSELPVLRLFDFNQDNIRFISPEDDATHNATRFRLIEIIKLKYTDKVINIMKRDRVAFSCLDHFRDFFLGISRDIYSHDDDPGVLILLERKDTAGLFRVIFNNNVCTRAAYIQNGSCKTIESIPRVQDNLKREFENMRINALNLVASCQERTLQNLCGRCIIKHNIPFMISEVPSHIQDWIHTLMIVTSC